MAAIMKWHFPEGSSNVGFNVAGLRYFTGDTGLFREVIQNSLDAKQSNATEDVMVELKLMDLPTEELDGEGLATALKRCQQSRWLSSDGRKQFAQAEKLLAQDTIQTLSITDVNTTGATAEATDNELTKWEGLTDSEGAPVGKGAKSGGSYGLGKHAPFAATPLRTVLYSTCYSDAAGHHHCRFIGRAMLVTHYDDNDRQLSHNGYLADEREPLCDRDIPDQFRMGTRGTQVLIPGWNWESTNEQSWEIEALDVIVEHYFYAVLYGLLGVTFERQNDSSTKSWNTLDQSTLQPGGDVHQLINGLGETAQRRKTLRYITATQQQPVATRFIPGVGDVKLHIDLHQENGRSNLVLVRYPGVKITDIAGNMGAARPRIPNSWQNFTAVVFITPRSEEDWVVRECESPTHDKIEIERVDDKTKEKKARHALRELKKWLRNEIEEVAGRRSDQQTSDADELIDYGLTVEDADMTRGEQRVRLIRPRVMKRAPQTPKMQAVDARETDVEEKSEDGDEVPDHTHLPEGRGSSKEKKQGNDNKDRLNPERRKPRQRPRVDLQPIFSPVEGSGQHMLTNQLRVSLKNPGQRQDIYVSVCTVGEDERDRPVGLKSVVANDKQLHIVDREQYQDSMFLLPSTPDNTTRVSVLLTINEPVAGRSFKVTPYQLKRQ